MLDLALFSSTLMWSNWSCTLEFCGKRLIFTLKQTKVFSSHLHNVRTSPETLDHLTHVCQMLAGAEVYFTGCWNLALTDDFIGSEHFGCFYKCSYKLMNCENNSEMVSFQGSTSRKQLNK